MMRSIMYFLFLPIVIGLSSPASALCLNNTPASLAEEGIKDDKAELAKPFEPVTGDQFGDLDGRQIHLASLRFCYAILGMAGNAEAKTRLVADLREVVSNLEKNFQKNSSDDIELLAMAHAELGAALDDVQDKKGAEKAYTVSLKMAKEAQKWSLRLEEKARLPKPKRYDEFKNAKPGQKFDATVVYPVIEYDNSLSYIANARKFRSAMQFLEGRAVFALGDAEKGKTIVAAALETDPDNSDATRFLGDFLQKDGKPILLPFKLAEDLPGLENVAISPDGEKIATINDRQHIVHVWDWKRGKRIYTGMPPGDQLRDDADFFEFAGNSTRLAVVEDTDFSHGDYLRIWDIADPSFRHESYFYSGSLLVSRDGYVFGNSGLPLKKDEALADPVPENGIRLYDLPDIANPRVLVPSHFSGAKISPDGRFFAISVGMGSGLIEIGEVATGKLKYSVTVDDYGGASNSYELSDNGKYLAYDHGDRHKIEFFDVRTGKSIGVTEQMGEIWGQAFFNKGEKLITWGDGGLAVWDTRTAKKETQLPNLNQKIRSAKISADETFLVGASFNGCATVWSIPRREMLVTLCARGSSNDTAGGVAILPTGKYFADRIGEMNVVPSEGSNDNKLKEYFAGEEMPEPISPS